MQLKKTNHIFYAGVYDHSMAWVEVGGHGFQTWRIVANSSVV